ncbi:Uncharacterised protein [Kluyvera cryocrescens]|uniref:Uncharacterized protein n=1 Tax=Kluyvera cryocrescens TaxID=580 RepID=A0A485C5U2_KLUCR|nr:Uncharacterised protein [Kluyvera cryocrescens]
MLDTTLIILLGLAALGFVSHNTTVAGLDPGFDYYPRHPR